MRTKRFILMVKVGEEFFREYPDEAVKMAGNMLLVRREEPLVGPRGGRYLPVGYPKPIGHDRIDDDFAQGVLTFGATQEARYIRPRK